MRARDILTVAARHSRARLLESFLIVLGIALGVAVTAAFAGLIGSVNNQVTAFVGTPFAREILLKTREEDYSVFWSESSTVLAVPVGPAGGATVRLTLEELHRIRQATPSASHVYPHHELGLLLSPAVTRAETVRVTATTPELFAAYGLKPSAGTLFTGSDVSSGARVIVLGSTLARRLFGPEGGIGQELTCSSISSSAPGAMAGPGGGPMYEVIGVLEPQASPGAGPEQSPAAVASIMGELDGTAFIPVTALPTQQADGPEMSEIGIMAPSVDQVAATLDALARLSERTYGGQLSLRSELDSMRRAMREIRSLALAILALASAGLTIAAINILNLMLARVLRRTRSIGISAALGASKKAVFAQFLAESLLLGIAGGVAGLVMAIGTTRLMSMVLGGFQVSVGSWGLLGGFGGSCLASLVFGLYPARLAAGVIPAEALKGE